jgi:hypothetical protein
MGHVKRQLVMWAAIATTAALLPGLALADNASPDFGGHHGRDHRHGNTKLAIRGRALSRGEHDAYGMQIRGRSGDKPTDAGGMVRFAHRGDTMAEGLVGRISCLSEDQAGVVTVTGTIKRGGTRASKGDKGKRLKPGQGLQPGSGTATMTDDDGTAMLDELAPWDDSDTADLGAADDSAVNSNDGDTVAADPKPPALPGAPSAPNMPAPPDKDPNKKHDGKRGGELAGKDFAFTIDVAGNPQHFSQPKIGDKGTLAACSGGGAPVAVTRGGFRTRDANGTKGDNGRDGRHRGNHRHGWWRR